MDLNELAVKVSRVEAGRVGVDIAQIHEVLHSLFVVLRELPADEMLTVVAHGLELAGKA